MAPPSVLVYLISLSRAINFFVAVAVDIEPFGDNYRREWGGDHVTLLNQGTQLTSLGYNEESSKNHDEVDFEFLGSNGPPYILNTNVFAQDSGNREQQFSLWFDPSLAFHDYDILWNQKQIVFFVDKVPIRVFKNYKIKGLRFPKLPMYVEASLWNGTGWLGGVDWSGGPFLAGYRGFEINGCPYDNYTSNPAKCESPGYDWNAPKYWQLDPQQLKMYKDVRNKHLIYDYCNSKLAINFPECKFVS
ncbi:Xyloglucan endotransglucosylase/hydrolase protein 3 [Sesamum alatum]|uniref:Xyloglucan endotransglucosylase/hydrolase n=1 Tax=Sesamum alatum TaxID=300844 RepID=A0AAE1XK46_9LAMI|nr:Xyloglucan endotransglucosylase/hydrolase protein 3 [Sesamum alatum]